MLRSEGSVPYRSFSDKVEHLAENVYFTTERTVLIYRHDTAEAVARYNECGLV